MGFNGVDTVSHNFFIIKVVVNISLFDFRLPYLYLFGAKKTVFFLRGSLNMYILIVAVNI